MALNVAKIRRRLPPPPVEGTPALETPAEAPQAAEQQASAESGPVPEATIDAAAETPRGAAQSTPVKEAPATEVAVDAPAEAPRVAEQPAKIRKPSQARPALKPKPTGEARPVRRGRAPVTDAEPVIPMPRLDGRSLRATGRVVQLNLKVSGEMKDRFIQLAAERGLLMTELFERMVELLEEDSDLLEGIEREGDED